jgi:hypothetical protein
MIGLTDCPLFRIQLVGSGLTLVKCEPRIVIFGSDKDFLAEI